MNRIDALNLIADALTDAHYWEEGENLPGSEVLAEIAVKAFERAGWTLTPPVQSDGNREDSG